ncbi:MAG: ArsR family transcriptional regulator, zinc-responsive transcriptional repressor [Frankiaceae bacterium]|nr:ArsR family transcriptional regulator, zinc-responsive transcriptional repressor [Frankiaceae bacterium]
MTTPSDAAAGSRAQPHDPGPLPVLPSVELSDYDAASELLRALSAPLRLAIVDLLTDAPRCVHELVEALGVSQPLASQHLKTLRAAGLVATQRRGREMVYRLVDEHVSHVARDTIAHSREQRDGA